VSVIQQLIKEFSRLPGVGSKTAQRFGYHLLKRPREEAFGLAAAIRELAEKIGPCEVCGKMRDLFESESRWRGDLRR
jgi:recombination protein RecR